MSAWAPPWVDALTAFLVVVGALAALIGSFGLLRLKSFFQRMHAPTLPATLGTWGFTLATAVQASFERGQPYLHALLIAVFIALTAPVTTLFLMRAAVFAHAFVARRSLCPARTPPGMTPPSPLLPKP